MSQNIETVTEKIIQFYIWSKSNLNINQVNYNILTSKIKTPAPVFKEGW